MYIIEPLYAGDISAESIFTEHEIVHLVYELDEIWNGDMLIAGTDVFIVGGELLSIMKSDHFKGFTLRETNILYEGSKSLPDFMQLLPEETLKVIRNEYTVKTDNDIYITQNAGEIAVSDRLFESISKYMDKRNFKFHEIYFTDRKTKSTEKYNYEYVIITACSTPMELLPSDIKKRSRLKNGTYIIKEEKENVYVSAPYLECLRQFDIDVHGYMNIYEPYFLTVKGNDEKSVKAVIKSMCSRNFYIARSFSEQFINCFDFISYDGNAKAVKDENENL